jgi:hypothetical protein
MKFQIATAVLTGVLSLAPASPALATTVSRLNSRDLMIQGASETAKVELHFTGAERLELGAPGELVVNRRGSLKHYRPDAYQIVNGKARHLTISYKLNGADRVTVNFGNFDNSAPIFLRDGASTM